jgi:transmembrane sensor
MLTSPVSGLLASFQEHYDDLLQFLTRRMSDRQRAADVAQETYLKLVNIDEQAVPVLHARSFIFAWPATWHRCLAPRAAHAASHDDRRRLGGGLPGARAEAALLARERLRIPDQALLQLPDNARRALLLNRVEGLTSRSAARLGFREHGGQVHRPGPAPLPRLAQAGGCGGVRGGAGRRCGGWRQAPMLLADYHTASASGRS